MYAYAKINYPRGRGVLVEIMSENEQFIYCRRVNKHGEDLSYENEHRVIVEPFELIQKTTITKRTEMVMSNTYAWLVPKE